jgi:hypothetical protein
VAVAAGIDTLLLLANDTLKSYGHDDFGTIEHMPNLQGIADIATGEKFNMVSQYAGGKMTCWCVPHHIAVRVLGIKRGALCAA